MVAVAALAVVLVQVGVRVVAVAAVLRLQMAVQAIHQAPHHPKEIMAAALEMVLRVQLVIRVAVVAGLVLLEEMGLLAHHIRQEVAALELHPLLLEHL
jgi:hypothetical protein